MAEAGYGDGAQGAVEEAHEMTWRWFRRRRRDPRRVSQEWLTALDQQSSRVDFHGVSIRWPIQKQADSSPLWNARRLKRRA